LAWSICYGEILYDWIEDWWEWNEIICPIISCSLPLVCLSFHSVVCWKWTMLASETEYLGGIVECWEHSAVRIGWHAVLWIKRLWYHCIWRAGRIPFFFFAFLFSLLSFLFFLSFSFFLFFSFLSFFFFCDLIFLLLFLFV
jgi:hypothetical protein